MVPRVRRVSLILTILLAGATEAQASSVRVVYEVEASAGSWQPISPKDLGRAVEHAALQELSKPGLMTLERHRGRGAGQKKGDYKLTIAGHLLDEAETHTVYLSFEPGEKSDVPSVNTSETVVLSKQSRGKMLERIEASARKAAKRLVKILKPEIARAGRGVDAPPPDDLFDDVKKWPWSFGDVRVPKARVGNNGKRLYSKKKKVREAALRVLTSLALRESSPRQILERCVLDHFDDDTRLGCLVALRPLSRKHQPTRRVVVEAFRKGKTGRIESEATKQMRYFSGPSKAMAIQAWMEAASKGRSYGPLDELGDLPNLDLAVRKCLTATTKKKLHKTSLRKPGTCIDLLKPVPYKRRRAVLWRFVSEMNPDSPYFLEGYGANEGSHGTIWASALNMLFERMTKWDPKLEEVLWKRYQRTLSSAALKALCSRTPPSEKGVKRLLEILKTTGSHHALNGLVRMGERDTKHAPKIREAIAEMIAMGTYAKNVRKNALESAIKKLERAEAKR